MKGSLNSYHFSSMQQIMKVNSNKHASTLIFAASRNIPNCNNFTFPIAQGDISFVIGVNYLFSHESSLILMWVWWKSVTTNWVRRNSNVGYCLEDELASQRTKVGPLRFLFIFSCLSVGYRIAANQEVLENHDSYDPCKMPLLLFVTFQHSVEPVFVLFLELELSSFITCLLQIFWFHFV